MTLLSHAPITCRNTICLTRLNKVVSTTIRTAASEKKHHKKKQALSSNFLANWTCCSGTGPNIIANHPNRSTNNASFIRVLTPQQQYYTSSSSSSTTTKPKKLSPQEKLRIADTIRKIKADLIEADLNQDGNLQPDELKLVLEKYPDVFSEKDVLEIRDLFYAGKGGGSVSHEQFMQAGANALGLDDGAQHPRKTNISHPLGIGQIGTEYLYGKHRGVYSQEELDVKLTHVQPKTTSDKAAKTAVSIVRLCFDFLSGWNAGEITQAKVLRRVVFLETVAGIPGFVAAMYRHLKSLRTFQRDGGMLNMFFEEANNQRMHLLSFVHMHENPGTAMRVMVMASQVVTGTIYFVVYGIAPKLCHRFVGYIQEEACETYTTLIQEIETGSSDRDISEWRTQVAPGIARAYWHLGEDGTVLDMIYAIRADEAEHRDVNHVVSGLKEGQLNPLYDPEGEFDIVLKKYVQKMMEQRGNSHY